MKVTEITKMNETEGGERMKRLIKNNKGFSLVELLIVIAIMGVLAVIAFNMFGGVLTSSKKKADDQMAQNIAKGILTYCIDSNDWKLDQGTVSGGAILSGSKLKDLKGIEAVLALTNKMNVDSKPYGPYFTLKDPAKGNNDANNKAALSPQWNSKSGGDYADWKIDVYPDSQNVTCVPTTTSGQAIVVH